MLATSPAFGRELPKVLNLSSSLSAGRRASVTLACWRAAPASRADLIPKTFLGHEAQVCRRSQQP